MEFILALVIFGSMIVLGVGSVHMVVSWIDSRVSYKSTIKLETLKRYYNENPNPWALNSNHVKYIKSNGRYSYSVSTYEFSFSFVDYIKYRFWKWQVESEQSTNNNKAILAKIEKDYYGEEK